MAKKKDLQKQINELRVAVDYLLKQAIKQDKSKK